jgi:hypothetical protein
VLVTDAVGGEVRPMRFSPGGTFVLQTSVEGASGASVSVQADFDGDGHLDLAVLGSGGQRLQVLLGDGLGGYITLAPFTPGNGVADVVLGDFDRDGQPDLAVVEPATGLVHILRGISP